MSSRETRTTIVAAVAASFAAVALFIIVSDPSSILLLVDGVPTYAFRERSAYGPTHNDYLHAEALFWLQYDAVRFQRAFRLSPSLFMHICEDLDPLVGAIPGANGRPRIHIIVQHLIFLQLLSGTFFLRTLQGMYDVSEGSIINIRRRFSQALIVAYKDTVYGGQFGLTSDWLDGVSYADLLGINIVAWLDGALFGASISHIENVTIKGDFLLIHLHTTFLYACLIPCLNPSLFLPHLSTGYLRGEYGQRESRCAERERKCAEQDLMPFFLSWPAC